MKVFSYDFGVPSIVHFPLFEDYARNHALMKEGIKRTPFHLRILSRFLLHVTGEKKSSKK